MTEDKILLEKIIHASAMKLYQIEDEAYFMSYMKIPEKQSRQDMITSLGGQITFNAILARHIHYLHDDEHLEWIQEISKHTNYSREQHALYMNEQYIKLYCEEFNENEDQVIERIKKLACFE